MQTTKDFWWPGSIQYVGCLKEANKLVQRPGSARNHVLVWPGDTCFRARCCHLAWRGSSPFVGWVALWWERWQRRRPWLRYASPLVQQEQMNGSDNPQPTLTCLLQEATCICLCHWCPWERSAPQATFAETRKLCFWQRNSSGSDTRATTDENLEWHKRLSLKRPQRNIWPKQPQNEELFFPAGQGRAVRCAASSFFASEFCSLQVTSNFPKEIKGGSSQVFSVSSAQTRFQEIGNSLRQIYSGCSLGVSFVERFEFQHKKAGQDTFPQSPRFPSFPLLLYFLFCTPRIVSKYWESSLKVNRVKWCRCHSGQ